MSYCRFSSDDFKSDFYIFESEKKWEVVVASSRVDDSFYSLQPENVAETKEYWAKGESPPWIILLEGPFAGTAKAFDSPGEAADWAEMVAEHGFHLPSKAVERLRSDQEALNKA